MIDQKITSQLKVEIDSLSSKLNEINKNLKHNNDLSKIKKVLNNNKYDITKLNYNKLYELLKFYKIDDVENIKKDIYYIIYIYNYYLKFFSKEDFSQKIEADKRILRLINVINGINPVNCSDHDSIESIYVKMQSLYNKILNKHFKEKITEIDVLNYINIFSNISQNEKKELIKNIEEYNNQVDKYHNSNQIIVYEKKEEKVFDPYIVAFCNMIRVLDKNKIKENLPESFMSNCMYILNTIIEYIDYQIEIKNHEYINDPKVEEIKNIVVEYKSEIEEELKFNEIEQEKESIFSNKIIYFNEYVFNDIKSINEDLYDYVVKSIEILESGSISTNIKKHRKLNNNNSIKNVFEIKKDKIRLFYTPIGNNVYVVLLIGQKRAKMDSYLIDKVEKRIAEFNMLYNSNKLNIDSLVETGYEISDEAKSIINEKRRKM